MHYTVHPLLRKKRKQNKLHELRYAESSIHTNTQDINKSTLLVQLSKLKLVLIVLFAANAAEHDAQAEALVKHGAWHLVQIFRTPSSPAERTRFRDWRDSAPLPSRSFLQVLLLLMQRTIRLLVESARSRNKGPYDLNELKLNIHLRQRYLRIATYRQVLMFEYIYLTNLPQN